MGDPTQDEIRDALDGLMSDYEAADILGDAYRALLSERDTLREACRSAYHWAWNIEQKSNERFTVQRALEIKRVTMGALQATNAEFQARDAIPIPNPGLPISPVVPNPGLSISPVIPTPATAAEGTQEKEER
jgi:hypothetical protein